MVINWDSFDKN